MCQLLATDSYYTLDAVDGTPQAVYTLETVEWFRILGTGSDGRCGILDI